MRSGRLNKWVTLERSPQEAEDTDGFWEALSPNGAWAAIEPLSPAGDGRTLAHAVTIRYHEQVTMDTRITYVDQRDVTHYIFVKGFQDVGMRNVEMRLICEEIVP